LEEEDVEEDDEDDDEDEDEDDGGPAGWSTRMRSAIRRRSTQTQLSLLHFG